jgi:phage-related protein
MAELPGWTLDFYTDARGRSPVAEFLASLPVGERARCARVLALLQDFGLHLGMPHARPVGDLWELRAGAGRLFYVAYRERRFVILHGYLKKSRRAPIGEIEVARRRLADWMERQA